MVQAIETSYDGYKFRSRLEARYAVFLKYLCIKYVYESEGFELPSGRYLPDFWLPEFEMFIEVKDESKFESYYVGKSVRLYSEKYGRFVGFDFVYPYNREKTFARELALMTNYPVQIVYGDPLTELTRQLDSDDDRGGENEAPIYFGDSQKCCLALMRPENWLGDDYYGSRAKAMQPSLKKIWAAAKVARQARFEFGESG